MLSANLVPSASVAFRLFAKKRLFDAGKKWQILSTSLIWRQKIGFSICSEEGGQAASERSLTIPPVTWPLPGRGPEEEEEERMIFGA